MKKIFLSFPLSILIFYSNISFSAPVPAGQGIGEILYIKSGSKNLCVYGQSVNSKYYASIDYTSSNNCKSRNAPTFIFTVSGQVASKINSKWWCLTAPNTPSVQSSYDYVLLKPCSLIDPNQKWQYSSLIQGLKTAQNGYELRETNWGLAVSAQAGRLNKFNFNFSGFQRWINDDTQVRGGINFELPLGWSYKSDKYSLSSTSFYNPEKKLIYQINSSNPAQWLCLRSWQTKKPSPNWDWVDWVDCGSNSSAPELLWDVDTFTSVKKDFFGLVISDKNGNLLRVSRTGSKWGTPYTVSIAYSKKDTNNNPTSIFTSKANLRDYLQLESGNIGKTLSHCPAPGGSKIQARMGTRTLPSGFDLNRWLDRIYAVVSQPGGNIALGSCGTCFMQAIELVREFYLYPHNPPLSTQAGVLFPVDGRTHLLDYIRTNDSRRYQRAQRIAQRYASDLIPGIHTSSIAQQHAALSQASIEVFLPNYDITTSSTGRLPQSQAERIRLLDDFLQGLRAAAVGRVWIVTYSFERPGAEEDGHAILMLRTESGIQLLDTNINSETMSFAAYRTESSEIIQTGADLSRVLLRYSGSPRNRISQMDAHRIDPSNQAPGGAFALTSSFGDCNSSTSSTGAQTGGMGSGQIPTGEALNQCSSSSGKCYLQ